MTSSLGREKNAEVLERLEGCLFGTATCPERPVILSNYIYVAIC